MTDALLQTDLPLENKRSGKVRDLYDVSLPDGTAGILIVATDRVSAFDVVLENGMPGKGVVLTRLSSFWFDYFSDHYKHHLISTDVEDIPGISAAQRQSLRGRVMLCRRANVVPIECIARGYITGSGWKDYLASGSVCGHTLPENLLNGSALPEILFTPSTKAESGHDENITLDQGVDLVGKTLMHELETRTLSLYRAAREYAHARGIILADTKFEFGILPDSDELILIDEIFTPDSSRFWPADEWIPGQEQVSFDKQYIRNHLEKIVSAGEWDKTAPGPALPDSVISATMARYEEAFKILTDSNLAQH